MKKIKGLLILILFFIPSLILAPIDISMSPPKMEFHLKEKKKVREVIELENRSFKPIHLKVYTAGFSIEEDGDLIFSREDSSAEEWIKVSPGELTIKPYDYGIVRYEIHVPEGSPAGSYTASIMIEEILPPEESKKPTQFIIKGRMAHIVYANIGKPDYKGKIEWFKVEREEDKLIFSFYLKNEGDFYFRTKGSIKIIGEKEKNIKEIFLPNVPVLRRTNRIIEVSTSSKDLSLGKYRALLLLDIGTKTSLQAQTEFSISGSN